MKYILLMVFSFSLLMSKAQSMKGFDLSNALIPLNEIKNGGPPKDGIPSIDAPQFRKTSDLKLAKDTRVLGVVVNGVAKAYPIPIMNYHEIVNDLFGHQPVVITYCPLCGSGIAFDASKDQETRTFGVSGLLYNSDVLLYDRQTSSLWSQIMMRAVAGPLAGEELQMIPTMNTTLEEWQQKHPDTWVLTEDTGYHRDYARNPYPGYDGSTQLYFEVTEKDQRFHPKEMVIGIEINGEFKAYPFSKLKKLRQSVVKDKFQGQDLIITYYRKSQSAEITDQEGKQLPAVSTFWFAWYAFHPETEVFRLKSEKR